MCRSRSFEPSRCIPQNRFLMHCGWHRSKLFFLLYRCVDRRIDSFFCHSNRIRPNTVGRYLDLRDITLHAERWELLLCCGSCSPQAERTHPGNSRMLIVSYQESKHHNSGYLEETKEKSRFGSIYRHGINSDVKGEDGKSNYFPSSRS